MSFGLPIFLHKSTFAMGMQAQGCGRDVTLHNAVMLLNIFGLTVKLATEASCNAILTKIFGLQSNAR